MKAIVKKEINAFFASPEAYIIIAVFLLLNGLFLWVFKTAYNIFDSGFADLNIFFQWVPWIFIFLIPAVTMKSFSEEKRSGTLELLLTKPLPLRSIILGKFLGIFLVICIALLPTLLYGFMIKKLSVVDGVLDLGSMIASYFGLLFITGAYIAIGMFTSALTRHQPIAFILGASVCFFMYYGFEGISGLSSFDTLHLSLSVIGMKAHFNSISRGVLDTRDLIYFLSLTSFFLFLTKVQIKYYFH